MRDLVRQILAGFKSVKLVGQEDGYVVFTAQEPDTQQAVTVKVLPRLLGQDAQSSRQFEVLSRALRQLNHPNIVGVRQVGTRAGMPYIVTRAVEQGQRLSAALDRPWDLGEAADVVMQAGRALEHAYNKGVVHGALTPENITVDDKGRVSVGGFGLRELLEMAGAPRQGESSPFIAPERAAGKPASPRSDVYSLAAILYRLLAGRPPQVVKGEVLPPSRFNREAPAGFDPILLQALAPDPEQRFPDVKAFLAALGGVTLAASVHKAPAEAGAQVCPLCGTANQSARFCRKCGGPLAQPTAAAAARPRPAGGAPVPRQPVGPGPAGRQATATAAQQRPPAPKSKLDEPIQITRIEVGHLEIGKGVELHETVIAQPMPVATGSISAEFPEPLPMPQLKVSASGLFASDFEQPPLAMPAPPPMPVIDWGEISPPMPAVPTIEDIPIKQERP